MPGFEVAALPWVLPIAAAPAIAAYLKRSRRGMFTWVLYRRHAKRSLPLPHHGAQLGIFNGANMPLQVFIGFEVQVASVSRPGGVQPAVSDGSDDLTGSHGVA